MFVVVVCGGLGAVAEWGVSQTRLEDIMASHFVVFHQSNPELALQAALGCNLTNNEDKT